MKRFIVAAFIYLSVAAPIAARAADTCATGRPQIAAVISRYQAAVRIKDLDAIMSLYERGQGLYAFDVTPPLKFVGWQAYKSDWRNFLAIFKGPIQDTITELSIDCDGALGYSHSIERMAGTLTNGQKTELVARVTDVYRKVGGKWYVVHEHLSVPVDLTTGKGVLK